MHNIIQIIIQKWQAIPISLQERSNPEFFKKNIWICTLTLHNIFLFIDVKIHYSLEYTQDMVNVANHYLTYIF